MVKKYKPTVVYIEAADLGHDFVTVEAGETLQAFEGCEVAVFQFVKFARVETKTEKTFNLVDS